MGSHTVDRLIREGAAVTVFDVKNWKEAENLHNQKTNITYIEGDIRDFEFLKKSMKGHTHVLHLAAVVSVMESIEDPITSHEVNVTGTLNVFESARLEGVTRVVYASSAAVYGNQDIIPISEDAAISPQSPYGLHKSMNDSYATLYSDLFGLSTIGLRYFNIFGERQDPSSPYSGVISIFVDRTKREEKITIFGDGSATRDFIHVDNIVDANIRALSSIHQGVCNVGSGKETSLNMLIDALSVIYGRRIVPEYKEERSGDIMRSCPSIEKIHRLLAYTVIVDFNEGLTKLISA